MITSIQHSKIVSLNLSQVAIELYSWLARQLEETSLAWLDQTIQKLAEETSEQILFSRFSAAPRQVSRTDLALVEMDLQTAKTLRAGWNPGNWSVDQATRTLLLLTFPSEDTECYVSAIEKLFSAADMAEQVALYQSLPLFPHPERFRARAIEGLRSNITAVFNAIALRNPYPADYFDEAAWNQMVLKALFVESHLSQIQRLDERANPKLARMLSDYAHERWAANRPVNPQLWRPLGPFAKGNLIADLARVLNSSELFEQQAAALASASAATSEAQELLAKVPALKQQIEDKQLTWDSFSLSHS